MLLRARLEPGDRPIASFRRVRPHQPALVRCAREHGVPRREKQTRPAARRTPCVRRDCAARESGIGGGAVGVPSPGGGGGGGGGGEAGRRAGARRLPAPIRTVVAWWRRSRTKRADRHERPLAAIRLRTRLLRACSAAPRRSGAPRWSSACGTRGSLGESSTSVGRRSPCLPRSSGSFATSACVYLWSTRRLSVCELGAPSTPRGVLDSDGANAPVPVEIKRGVLVEVARLGDR